LEAREQERIRDVPVPAPRHSVRRPFGVEALVNHGLSYSTPWRVRDLSLTGAFVEMDATQLPQGENVEFVLRYRYKNQSVEHRIPATVMRAASDGVALTFGRYDDQTYTDLANLLFAL
jgi:hemolysin activation/secretion protein